MFQGTCSDAGKSILTAALCRILLQDGLKVAPFKAQNMSLNSYVTHDGREMGRAQVVQAQAARLDPDVRMNPVLLKPSSDTGSQVIVNGRPVGNMQVSEYIRYKPEAVKKIHAAYDSLASEYDAVILEGAGSPAEINLKHHDIVNMQMARYADASVLISGDIERGGVFASLIGTMHILDGWEKDLVAGFVINRFRGQESLLKDGLTYLEAQTGRPVLGVVPYIQNLGLPEEDSVSFKNGLFDMKRPKEDHVTIALIDLPHISNFTDIEPFLTEPDVFLKIVRSPGDLSGTRPGALILPGSKNVINDIEYLNRSGLAGCISEIAANKHTEIVGICGGFQILGRTIHDPYALESAGKEIAGLGLLDITTTLEKDKTLTRQTSIHIDSGEEVHGYEIHHGRTSSRHKGVLRLSDGAIAGESSKNNRIWGSYLHGIFDADPFRRWFIDRLRKRCGLKPVERIVSHYDLEPAFDRLAETVRKKLDMDKIYELLEI